MQIRLHALAASTAITLVLGASPAWAQAAAAPASDTAEATTASEGEIVVTGTSIRGLVTPVGASTVTVDREAVKATGVTSAVDLLASIPQIKGFGTIPAGQASATQSFSIPTLRGLPNTQPGDGTLYLWNGNRMVGGGFNTRPDPAVVPPGIIERVDVVLGGGSAIYGSDAVAGTINFQVRKNLNGLEARGSYGFADNYSTFDMNAAWGKVWDTGNLLIAADYAGHSNIAGRDRDFYTNDLRSRGGSDFRSNSCPLANVKVPATGSTSYAYPTLAPNTTNFCDPTDNTDYYPRERRWSVLASFNQQLTENLEFSFDGYYARRTNTFQVQQTAASGTITSTNPYFAQGRPPSQPGATSETVNFNFASVFGNSLTTDQKFTTWQVIPSLKWTFGEWRAVATANYGYGDGFVHAAGVDPVLIKNALAGTTAATALNPFNLSQTNAGVLAAIRDYNAYDHRSHKMLQTKVVLDGPVFQVPAGDVRLAVGGERYWESQYSIAAAGPFGSEDPARAGGKAYGDREVWSAFAEAVVPLFGPENETPGFHSLTLNFAGRYDHFSDFGETWNPKIAGTWMPTKDFTIRADYSTAFVAPSLNSTTKPQSVQLLTSTASALIPPGGVANRPQITLQGGNPNLKPEKAKTYNIGIDLAPTYEPGLKVSLTYYHIDMRDVVAGPNTSLFFSSPGYSRFYALNPTSVAQIKAFQDIGTIPVEGGQTIDAFVAANGLPQIVIDSRTANLGRIVLSGVDYSIQYAIETELGRFTPGIAGTHGLRLDAATPEGSPFTDLFDNGNPRDSFSASLAYAGERFRARASWDYLGGFPVKNVVNQTYVKSFQTVNLYAAYELPDQGILGGTTVAVNVDNVFGREPSWKNVAGGLGNGSTFGRFVNFSIEKKF